MLLQKKPKVILLHGFLGSSLDWSDSLAGLEDLAEWVPLDLPGHGQDASLPTKFEDAFAKIAAVSVAPNQPLYLVGYSMGGRIALLWALANPGRVSRMVILSSHTGTDESASRWMFDQSWANRFSSEPLQTVIHDWYQQPLFTPLRQHSIFEKVLQKRALGNGHSLAAALLAFSVSKQGNLLPKVPLLPPTHWLFGEFDRSYRDLWCCLREKYHQSVKVIPKVGHALLVESPLSVQKSLSRTIRAAPVERRLLTVVDQPGQR